MFKSVVFRSIFVKHFIFFLCIATLCSWTDGKNPQKQQPHVYKFWNIGNYWVQQPTQFKCPHMDNHSRFSVHLTFTKKEDSNWQYCAICQFPFSSSGSVQYNDMKWSTSAILFCLILFCSLSTSSYHFYNMYQHGKTSIKISLCLDFLPYKMVMISNNCPFSH